MQPLGFQLWIKGWSHWLLLEVFANLLPGRLITSWLTSDGLLNCLLAASEGLDVV
jgi:hypothetical protein